MQPNKKNSKESRIQKNTASIREFKRTQPNKKLVCRRYVNQKGGAGLAQGPAGANKSMAKSMAGAPPQSLMLQSTRGAAQKGKASQAAKGKADLSQAFKASKSMKKK